jgi:hypothetical protein
MRRSWYGVGLAIGCAMLVPSCGSDSDPAPPAKGGTSGTRGDGGPDGSGAGVNTGGVGGSAGSGGAGTGGDGGTTGGGTAGSSGAAGTAGGGTAGVDDGGDAPSDGADVDGDDAGPDVVDANPCPACPNGACVNGADGSVCVECTANSHCSNPKPYCDLDRNVCEECLPTNDVCPNGQYCGAEKRCVKGCKDASSCASGVCNSAHDCDRCVSDTECSGQKLCGSGTCGTSCTASGPPDQCGTGSGFSCCEPKCVRVDRDVLNCKTCGTVCDPKQFCGKTACTNATISNVCNLPLVAAVLDGAPNDDQAARDILAGLEARCAPVPTTRSVPQPSADVINPTTGRVVAPGGELLVFSGGRYLQKGVGFLEDQRSVPVYSGGQFPNVSFIRSSDNSTIATSLYEEPGYHDIIVIEVGRDVSTGTPSLVAYGFHANGTRAAAWYFVNRMLPDLTNYPAAWYVYEWVDINQNLGPDSGDSFTERSHGN